MAVRFVGTSPSDTTPIQPPYFRVEPRGNTGEIIITDTVNDIGGNAIQSTKRGTKNGYKWKLQLLSNNASSMLTLTLTGRDFFIKIKNDGQSSLQNSWEALTQTDFGNAVAGMQNLEMPMSSLPRAVVLLSDAFGIEYSSQNPIRDFRTKLHRFSKTSADFVFVHLNTDMAGGFVRIYHTT